MIASYDEITVDNINWNDMHTKIAQLRQLCDISCQDAADELNISEPSYKRYESPTYYCNQQHRPSVGTFLKIVKMYSGSLNWLLNGIGTPQGADPPELMPQTLQHQKYAGAKKEDFRRDADEGHYTDEALEFVMAIDQYKRTNNIKFPSYTQIFELIRAMGYRKVEKPTILVPKFKKER